MVKPRTDLTSLDLYNKSVDYLYLYGYTTRVTGLTGDNFHFDNNGDGPARYNIIHFKQVEPGTFKWIKVGVYSDGKLNLNMDGEYFTWKYYVYFITVQALHMWHFIYLNQLCYSSVIQPFRYNITVIMINGLQCT